MEDRLDEPGSACSTRIKFMLASPAEDAAEILAPPRANGLGRGQVRRHPRPAPSPRVRRSASTAATCTTSAASSRRSWTRRASSTGTESWTARSSRYADGHVLPFLTLQARLGRKAPSADVQAEVPVVYVAFDLLAIGPRSATSTAAGRLPGSSSAVRRSWPQLTSGAWRGDRRTRRISPTATAAPASP